MTCSSDKCCNALGHRDELIEREKVVKEVDAELKKVWRNPDLHAALHRLRAKFDKPAS